MAYICICNPFNEKSVQGFLEQAATEKKVIKIIDAYRACSGKEKPNCGTCTSALRDIVDKHNEALKPRAEPAPEPLPQ